jgi:proteasome assembly chaperone (PAC2) family protein
MADAPQQPLPELREPWLIAAWPGMGNIAIAAAAYLIKQLDATMVHELATRDMFDVQQVEVKRGVAKAGRLPRSMFFEWRDPQHKRDLIIFVGEAQPNAGGYSLCHRIMEYAMKRGVKRVFTFAAMATQLHPTADPRVFAAATDRALLATLREQTVEVLKEGQISGLNGVLLAAAAEHGVPGACLLGELPFFAVGVTNPKAAQAVLEIFAKLTGMTIDFNELKEQADQVEQGLVKLLEKMQQAAADQVQGEEGFNVPEFAQDDDEEETPNNTEPPTPRKQPTLDLATRQRIEQMFDEANRDRRKAVELKAELDRLGVFTHYENRFLDLFKKAD